MTDYFFINSHTPDAAIIRKAVFWLIDKLDEEEAIVHVPVLSNLQGNIETALGRDIVKKLKAKKSVMINGASVTLSSDNSMAYRNNPVRILSMYAKSKSLDNIESHFPNISKILALPWLHDDISEWKEVRRATELG